MKKNDRNQSAVSVSVVMPVYNSEKYLERVLMSVISQEFEDWELIVIDDGSTDKSGIIIDDYAAKDRRIKAYHRRNGGVAEARQFGIDCAEGSYIIHLDSDDWVEPDYLSSLYQYAIAHDADMVWCDLFAHGKGSGKYSLEESLDKMIRALLMHQQWGSLVNRMFRAEICKSPMVRMPKGRITWAEDTAYCISALLQCNKIKYLPRPLYHYNTDNETSLLHVASRHSNPDAACVVANHISQSIEIAGRTNDFIYEIRFFQIWAVKDYLDDIQERDLKKFAYTFPDAMRHLRDYKNLTSRYHVCYWLIIHKMALFVPFVWKICILFRRIGLLKN